MAYNPPEDLPIIWRDGDATSYEQARTRVAHANVSERYPRAIIKPTNIDHVVAAVKLARDLQCRVSVRSGGHSWQVWSNRQDAILVDFINFGYIKYNQDTEIVEASPATTSRQICSFLKEQDRFLPAGHCGEVGMGGFLLQGGMGYLIKAFGPTCRFVLAVDVVTATGEVLHCDKDKNAELYWAARGAGPGFPGIVTRFYIKTLPGFNGHRSSTYIYPITAYDEVMTWFAKTVPSLNDLVEPFVHISNTPNEGYVLLVAFQSLAPTDEQAKQNLENISKTHPTGPLVQAQEMAKTSFDECYDFAETPEAYSTPRRWITLNSFLENSVDVVATIRRRATSLPMGGIMVWYPLYPASREKYEDMAWSIMSDHYVAWYASYTDPKEEDFHRKWIHDTEEELDPYTVGSYLGDADFALRPTKYWSDEAGKRLMAIRKKWDPMGRIAGFMDANDGWGAEGLSNVKAVGKFGSRLA